MTHWRSTTSVFTRTFERWLLCGVAALIHVALYASSVFGISSSSPPTVFDLREGARTSLYGGGFGQGTQVGDFYGWAMALGDVDGDGFTDFISSSANADGPNDTHGPQKDAYLVFGGPHAEMDSLYAVDAGDADIIFYRAGFGIVCDDIDNDGFDDLVFAEHEISILFGRPRDQFLDTYSFKTDSPGYTPPDIYIVGSLWLGGAVHNILNFGYDTVGRSLVSGDLNDDGFADIVFGNHAFCDLPGTCLNGAAYVLLGRPRAELPSLVDVDYSSSSSHPDIRFLGDTNEGYPFNLAIGDLDGDGIDDLVASASGWGENNTTPGLGEINGWWGKRDWKPVYDTQVDDFDFALQGTHDADGDNAYGVGYRIEIGDLDGDGRDDLILGDERGYRAALPADRRSMGEYRIIFGRSRALWPKWGEAVDMTDVLVLGASTVDALVDVGNDWGICFSLSTGDRDGDGHEDLLIGAGHARRSDDATRPGSAYLLQGRPRSQWEPLIDLRDDYDVIVYGADYTGSPGRQYDLLGFMTEMGDIDGNGKDEMFIAAPFADGPNNSIPDCGEIYVIYDSDTGTPTSGPTRPPLARASLLSNYPNPFNASTTLRLQAPRSSLVSLTIYDALGREVARPIVGATMVGDEMEFLWDAVDDRGRALPSGVYFVKLRAANESHSRKVLLVR